MSSFTNRPYSGTWNLNQMGIIRYGPDALVYVNGETSLPTFAADHRVIDIQPYITNVSADCGCSAGASSASVSLALPQQMGSALFRDGHTVISVGLEVHIYMRGYFPIKGAGKANAQEDLDELHRELGDEASNLPMRPFYPVFHGVITTVNHSRNGGLIEIGFECAGMLHFWETQTVSINGPLLGSRPRGSKTTMHYQTGHKFTNMTPFAVIYSLYKDVGGSAAGIGYALSSSTNIASEARVTGREQMSMFQAAQLYWERRFATKVYGLKMYGVNGALFNLAQQAIMGRMSEQQMKEHAAADFRGYMAKKYQAQDPLQYDSSKDWTSADKDALEKAFKGSIFRENIDYLSAASEKADTSVSVPSLKAFATDYSTFGSVNLYEGTYESKLDLANQVATACGYEFYQDVDGDLVFKPPMYNLDTRSSPAYNVRPIDIISLNFTEAEPDVTYMTCKSGAFSNTEGVGLDGQWGVKGMYVDYRLIAKYGWKPGDFESSFYKSGREAFYAAVASLDRENKNMYSASLTIPMRPELRPGYPIYIQHIDAFYYIESVSHSLTYGGQATTSMQLHARRIKFIPPGFPSDNVTGIDAVTLDKPWNPPLPMMAAGPDGKSIKVMGFPNVVMAYDPTRQSPSWLGFDPGLRGAMELEDVQVSDETITPELMLLRKARDVGIVRFANPSQFNEGNITFNDVSSRQNMWEKAQPQIVVGRENGVDVWADIDVSKLAEQRRVMAGLKDQFERDQKRKNGKEQWNENKVVDHDSWIDLVKDEGPEAITLIVLMKLVRSTIPGFGENTSNAAQLLEVLSSKKATFSNADQPGYYRYYSSAHPDPRHQAVGSFSFGTDLSNTTMYMNSAPQVPEQSDRPVFKKQDRIQYLDVIGILNPEDSSEHILRRTYVELEENPDRVSAPHGFEVLYEARSATKGLYGGDGQTNALSSPYKTSYRNKDNKKVTQVWLPPGAERYYSGEKKTQFKASHNIHKLEFGQFHWDIPLLRRKKEFEPKLAQYDEHRFKRNVVLRFTGDSEIIDTKVYYRGRQKTVKQHTTWPGKYRFHNSDKTVYENLKPFLDDMSDLIVPRIGNLFGGFSFAGGFTYTDDTGTVVQRPSLLDEIFPLFYVSTGERRQLDNMGFINSGEVPQKDYYSPITINMGNEWSMSQLRGGVKSHAFDGGDVEVGMYKKFFPVVGIPLKHLPVVSKKYRGSVLPTSKGEPIYHKTFAKYRPADTKAFDPTKVNNEGLWEQLANHVAEVLWERVEFILNQMMTEYKKYVIIERDERLYDTADAQLIEYTQRQVLQGGDIDDTVYNRSTGQYIENDEISATGRAKMNNDGMWAKDKNQAGYRTESTRSEDNEAKALWASIVGFGKSIGQMFGTSFSFGGVYERQMYTGRKDQKDTPFGINNRTRWGYLTNTPIFPVSDNGGYEHFGSYGYGRGMDIRPGGSFETLMSSDPFEMVEDEMERYVAVLMGDYSVITDSSREGVFNNFKKAYGIKSNGELTKRGFKQNKILAQFGYEETQAGYDKFKKDYKSGKMNQMAFNRMIDAMMELETGDPHAFNGLVQTLDIDFGVLGSQSQNPDKRKDLVTLKLINYMGGTETQVTVTNAAYSLADLQPDAGLQPYGFIDGGSVVGDTFIDLAAFDPENFVNVAPIGESELGERSSPVATWVKDQMALKAISWQHNQGKLRGEENEVGHTQSVQDIKDDLLNK